MKNILIFAMISLLSAAAAGQTQSSKLPVAQEPIPFTYQGKLTLNSLIAQGAFDLKIYLCSVVDPTSQPTDQCMENREISGVEVINGVFTVHLDFARENFDQFEALYLEIHVRRSGTGDDFTTLTPRQQINASPFAISARSLNCTDCVTDSHIVSIAGSKVTGSVANADNALSAQNATNAVTAQNAINAVDLTSNQGSISGTKRFNDRVTLSGGAQVGLTGISSNGSIAVTGNGIFNGNGSGLVNVPGTLKWNVSSAAGSLQMQSNNGYVLTNTSPATITLPASPTIGDVVRVIAKSTGGFTVAMNSGQSILDWATTHQETTWTRQYSVASSGSTTYWYGITSSDDGTKLAAVEYPGIIATSTNSGLTWTARMPDDIRNYTCIASSSDGTRLIAGVEGGFLYTSTDSGVNWTARFADANRFWYSLASSSDGTKLIAADNRNIYTSTDSGVTWTSRMNPNTISRVASSADGTKLTAAVQNGHVYTSTNSGVMWFDRLSSTFNQWQSVASSADGSKLVAVEAPGKIWVSSNSGATWTSFTLGQSGINTSWNNASISSDGMRIAVTAGGVISGPGGLVVISYDGGNSWTPTGIGTVWSAVAVAGNGTKMAAATADNNLNKLFSGPLQTITVVDTLTGVKDSAIELVYIGNNQFAMVSSNGMTIPPHTY